MVMLLAIVLGLALLLGAHGAATRLLSLIVGMVVLLVLLSVLPQAGLGGADSLSGEWLIGLLALAALGRVLWQRRTAHGDEGTRRMYEKPRQRALPSPPLPDWDGDRG